MRISRVRIENLASDQISTLPAYEHAGVTREYEEDLRQRFDRGATSIPAGDDFYAHESYDESRFYGDRNRGDIQPMRPSERDELR